MHLRSGRRLSPPRAPAPGGQRRHGPAPPRQPEAGASGDGEEDRISSLHDDLLLAILARLRDTDEAARTSVLARRWRGTWTQLPRLSFKQVRLHVLAAAVAQVPGPVQDLRIAVTLDRIAAPAEAERVSSLLRDVAERLAPKKLTIYLQGMILGDIILPCFRATSYLKICDTGKLLSALPPAGSKFEALTTLKLEFCCIDLGDLLPMCPALRYLHLTDFRGDVTVHSPSLEMLDVTYNNNRFPHDSIFVDINAPLLKEIDWFCEYDEENVGLLCMRLLFLYYTMRRGVHQLFLRIVCCLDDLEDDEEVDCSFAEAIAQLPLFPKLSFVRLKINIKGHAFAPLLLHLLQILPVKAISVTLKHARQIGMQCPLNCPCEQVNNNWRDENIMLTDLQTVTLGRLKGHDDEVDFLNVLFRCATVFKRMTLKVASEGYNRIRSICEQYPHVKSRVYLA